MIFAEGYLNLVFWGIFLALIPFLIHLFKRFKKKEINFPAIFLFKDEIRQANRSINLRSNFVTLLRSLLILLFGLILAKPMTSSELDLSNRKELIKQKTITLILFDNSSSMGFYSHNSTLFQQALNQLKELITELPMNNPIIFEELASEPTIPVNLIKEKDKLIKHIDKIKLQNINTSI
ncbi:MAG: BatA domain-containing protein, partial [Spirochaetota bacterium]|nr:BatA domain-containing protein [Spirochaetota bacterium]